MEGAQVLKYLSRVLDLIDFLKTYELNSIYSEHDVRKTFFAKTANAVRVYYLGRDFEFMVSKLKAEGDYPTKEIPHIENLGWIMPEKSNAEFLHCYHSILKLNLLNGSWVCFESSLDEMFKAVIPIDVIEKMELRNYHQTVRLLREFDIVEELDERLRKKLRNRHIPINNKWNELFKLNYPVHRDVEQDRDFLEFFGSCRNCMHNNSISFKNAHFETKFGNFDFYEGKAIDFVTPDLIVEVVRELAEIYWAFCCSIGYEEVIIDPYSSQVEQTGY